MRACDNFFAYVNDEWAHSVEIPNGYRRWSGLWRSLVGLWCCRFVCGANAGTTRALKRQTLTRRRLHRRAPPPNDSLTRGAAVVSTLFKECAEPLR